MQSHIVSPCSLSPRSPFLEFRIVPLWPCGFLTLALGLRVRQELAQYRDMTSRWCQCCFYSGNQSINSAEGQLCTKEASATTSLLQLVIRDKVAMVTRGLEMLIALQAPMPTSYRVASFDGNGWHSEVLQMRMVQPANEDYSAAAIYGVKACC